MKKNMLSYFFLMGLSKDNTLLCAPLFQEYGEGRMTTGDVKKRLVQVVTEIVERHRMARAAVTDEVQKKKN